MQVIARSCLVNGLVLSLVGHWQSVQRSWKSVSRSIAGGGSSGFGFVAWDDWAIVAVGDGLIDQSWSSGNWVFPTVLSILWVALIFGRKVVPDWDSLFCPRVAIAKVMRLGMVKWLERFAISDHHCGVSHDWFFSMNWTGRFCILQT